MNPKTIKHSKVLFKNKSKLALLQPTIEATCQSSYSFVLATAEHLNEMNLFAPPNQYQTFQKSLNSSSTEDQDEDKIYSDKYQLWADYMFQLICTKKIIETEQYILFIIEIDEQRFEIVKQHSLFTFYEINQLTPQESQYILIIEALNIKPIEKTENFSKKVAIINFANSVLNADKLKPKMHVQGLFSGIFYQNGDSWKSYKILKGQIPNYQELSKYSTIILSGSTHSVKKMPPQFIKFEQIFKKIVSQNNKIKILGICFGHQFISSCNKSKVTTKPLTKGPRNIQLNLQSLDIQYFKQIENFQYRQLRLYKYHNDHVQILPEGFVRYGTSESCENEIFVSKNKKILSCQFHPEYTKQYIFKYEKRLNAYNKQNIGSQREIGLDEHHHKSVNLFRKGILNFFTTKQ